MYTALQKINKDKEVEPPEFEENVAQDLPPPMTSGPLNNDVQIEILLHLPVKSLLRFRSISKFHRDLIDSPSFQKLHSVKNKNKDDTLLLQFNSSRAELSLLLPNSTEFITAMKFSDELGNLRVDGGVEGLICIHNRWSKGPISICNPSLGKIKTLPPSPTTDFCHCPKLTHRNVGIGFDKISDQDYKVVELLCCYNHLRVRASLYSTRTNSWRYIVFHGAVYIIEAIKSFSRSGSYARWRAVKYYDNGGPIMNIMVSFDMTEEKFRIYHMPQCERFSRHGQVKIFTRCDLFFLFISQPYLHQLLIYKGRFKKNEILWRFSSKASVVIPTPKALWGPYLVGPSCYDLSLYNYCTKPNKFHKPLHLRRCTSSNHAILEYKPSFVSP